MDIRRRRLIQAGIAGGAAMATGLLTGEAQEMASETREPIRILVLGGTGFIGPHMVREALRRGHTVELFNRGRTNDELFPDLLTLIGDRDNDIDALKGRQWDVVIDNSGYVPRHVAASARLLADAASHYIFISSISAYASFAEPLDEDSPLATMPDETVEEVTGETYGPMKALCEQRAAEQFGADRLAVLRPTYICGPGDSTDRYTYWPVRTMRGGDMLWPGTPKDAIQIIDVRDLATFVVDVAERRVTGTYNTVTPAGTFSMGDLLEDSLAVTGADMSPMWVDYDFLERNGATEGRSLPIWAPPTPEMAHVATVSGRRAAQQGLRNRPPRETARDAIAWWKTLPAERTESMRAGLTAARETELLQEWRDRGKS